MMMGLTAGILKLGLYKAVSSKLIIQDSVVNSILFGDLDKTPTDSSVFCN